MIFVMADRLSLDQFMDWLSGQVEEDRARAWIVIRNVVVDRRVQIVAQPSGGAFLLSKEGGGLIDRWDWRERKAVLKPEFSALAS